MYIGRLFKRSRNLNQRLTIVSNTFAQKMNIGQDFDFVLINDPKILVIQKLNWLNIDLLDATH